MVRSMRRVLSTVQYPKDDATAEPTDPTAKTERGRRARVAGENTVVVPSKVFVMNLDFETTEDELAAHCAQYGVVQATELLIYSSSRKPRPSGKAIVEFSAEHEAKAAISGLEGSELGGRPLHVREYYSD